MNTRCLLERRRPRGGDVEPLEQRVDALLALGMVVVRRRVQPPERRIADQLHRVAASSSVRREPGQTEPGSGGSARRPVGLAVRERRERGGGVHPGDVAKPAKIVRLGREPSGGEHRLERAELAQQDGSLLLADASRARDAVGRVAAQRDEVDDLVGPHAVALDDAGRVDPGELGDAASGLKDRDAVADELVGVAIRSGDEGGATAGLLGDGRRREEVVGLEARLPSRRRCRSTRRAPGAGRAAR